LRYLTVDSCSIPAVTKTSYVYKITNRHSVTQQMCEHQTFETSNSV